jgi:hypothetical protein
MTFNKKSVTARAVTTLCLAVAAFSSVGAHAQSVSAQQQFINSMKSVYKNTSTASGTAAAQQQMNSGAQSDPLCNNLNTAKQNAAAGYVENKLPPDPTTVIQNSSCFLDVMDIKIPTTGFGFLDSFMGNLTPMLQSTACNKSTAFWNTTKNKMTSGQYGGLTNQVFGAVSSAASGQNTYSQSLATAASNGGTAAMGNAFTSTPTSTTAKSYQTTAQSLGLPSSVQNALDVIGSNSSQNAVMIQQVNSLTSNVSSTFATPNNNNGSGYYVSQSVASSLQEQVSSLRSFLGLP